VELVAAGEVRDAPGKQRRLLTPTTFSLLHAADFADRCERQIMPLLQGDYLVLADRYIYTAFARGRLARLPSTLAAQPLSLRAYSRHHILFSRASGHRGGTAS